VVDLLFEGRTTKDTGLTEGKTPNLGEKQVGHHRWKFINDIQYWFEKKDRLWFVISLLAFSSVLVLEAILNFASYDIPSARQVSLLLIPILAVFVFSIFWRSLFQTFLSLGGALATYGGIFFLYTVNSSSQLVNTHVADRLGVGIKQIATITITPSLVADRYFVIGIFALIFCLAMAIKPKRPR
jgi:drug/metabolite transporter superfamily protein YnfA